MRLCILTREFPPVTRYTGGIGTQYAILAAELARQGHDVHVVTVAPDASGGDRSIEGIELHLLSAGVVAHLRPVADIGWSLAVDRALRKLGSFDVVYAAEWGADAWRYAHHRGSGALVTNLTSSYVLMLEASGRTRSLRGRLGLAVQGSLERAQAERSDAIVACSQAILERLRVHWDIGGIRSAVLPNTLDVARTRALAATGDLPRGFPTGGPVVAFSGRLEVRKGVHELVAAMLEVWESRPEVNLVLLGGEGRARRGGMSRRLRELAGKHADRLYLLGHQPPERLFPAIAAADVVALPSRWEPFGIAALEAMALGSPLILTSGSGFEEFFERERDGLMVPPREPGSLAHAIGRLLDDPSLCRRLGPAAAATAELYDAPAVTRQHVDFFERLASGAT
jgi:glycosyltransferase involved in cell wall biosynthesis